MTASEVTIIGCGIIGANIAYHLTEAGVDDVTIVEKNQPASGATGRSAGFVTPYQFLGTGIHPDVTIYCTEFFEELEERSDNLDLYYKEAFTLARYDETVPNVEKLHEETAWPSEFITGPELESRLDPVCAAEVKAAVAFENGMFLDPYSATMSLLEVARDNGAEIHHETVEDITKSNGTFDIITDEQRHVSEKIVIAAGAWSNRLLSHVDTDVPLKPRISQIAMLQPNEGVDVPLVNDPDLDLYYRTEVDGDILLGGGVEKDEYDIVGFSEKATEPFLIEVSEKAGQIVSELNDARMSSSWAGLCSATPDRFPHIGETEIQDVYVSCGFNGEGVMYSPLAGRIVSDLITNAEPLFDLSYYEPDRYSSDHDFEIKSALEW